MKKRVLFWGMAIGLIAAGAAYGDDLSIHFNMLSDTGQGKEIGVVQVSDSPYGLILTPRLVGLAPGLHGFHVHQQPDCGTAVKDGKPVPGLAAGGHYDPQKTGKHEGPYGQGHLGDLPALYVGPDGRTSHPILAPRLKVSDLKGRSVIIHAGGDNYADLPEPLGGGGARVACGVVK